MTTVYEPGLYMDTRIDDCEFTVLEDRGPIVHDFRCASFPRARVVMAIRVWHGQAQVDEWFFSDPDDLVRIDR